MDTSKTLISFFVGIGITGCTALLGFLLTVFGPITYKNSKKYTIYIASLTAVSTLWLVQRSHLALGNSIFDVFALLLILWFFCFFLFWAGVVRGMKFVGHHHDFGDSSILSMQYMESRMEDHPVAPNQPEIDFPLTDLEGNGNPLRTTKYKGDQKI